MLFAWGYPHIDARLHTFQTPSTNNAPSSALGAVLCSWAQKHSVKIYEPSAAKKKTWSRFKMLPCYQRHTPTAFGQIPLYLEFPWKPRNKTLNLEKIKQAFRYNAKQLIATFPPEQRREILPQKKENKSVEMFKPNQDTQPSNHCTRIASCCTQLHQLPRLFLAGESRNVCTIRCHCLTNSLLEAAISMQPSGSKLFQPRGLAQRRTIRLLN